MTARRPVDLSDEEVEVICDALVFYAKDGPTDDDQTAVDWAAFSRSARLAEELALRLPIQAAQPDPPSNLERAG